MEKCKGVLGLLLGHKFEAKYDYAGPRSLNLSGYAAIGLEEEVVRALGQKTYRMSVCRRCGCVVKEGGEL